jgi:hypothetical protein
MTPRVKTFGWRILRKAVPSGARASKFSKHITVVNFAAGVELKRMMYISSFYAPLLEQLGSVNLGI